MSSAMSLSSSTTSTRLMRPRLTDYQRGTVEPFWGHSRAKARQLDGKSPANPSKLAGTRVDEEKATEGIMALHKVGRKGASAAAVLGLGALLVGCSRETGPYGAQLAANGAAAPLSVSCEPNQRAVVRQVAVNGALQAQVQCESLTSAASAYAPIGTTGSFGATAPAGFAQAP